MQAPMAAITTNCSHPIHHMTATDNVKAYLAHACDLAKASRAANQTCRERAEGITQIIHDESGASHSSEMDSMYQTHKNLAIP